MDEAIHAEEATAWRVMAADYVYAASHALAIQWARAPMYLAGHAFAVAYGLAKIVGYDSDCPLIEPPASRRVNRMSGR